MRVVEFDSTFNRYPWNSGPCQRSPISDPRLIGLIGLIEQEIGS